MRNRLIEAGIPLPKRAKRSANESKSIYATFVASVARDDAEARKRGEVRPAHSALFDQLSRLRSDQYRNLTPEERERYVRLNAEERLVATERSATRRAAEDVRNAKRAAVVADRRALQKRSKLERAVKIVADLTAESSS